MAAFIRRFTSVPSIGVLSEIEAIDIIDLPPQSPTTGVGTGTLLCVGEFEDGSFATAEDAEFYVGAGIFGVQEVFGSEDLVTRYGGFGYRYGSLPYQNPCARRHLQEFWNGNGFIKLKYCEPQRLVIARVDTSVGEVAFTPLASILGGAGPFNLTVGDLLTVTTDLGGPSNSTALAAAVASITGAVFVASGYVGGESIVIQIDGGPNVTVTFSALDQTPTEVAARINLVLGYAAASVVAGAVRIVGIVAGLDGEVVLANGSPLALTAIGHVPGTTAGTGNVGNINAVTAAEVAAIVNGTAGLAAINAGASLDGSGRLRLTRTGGVGDIEVTTTAMATVIGLEPLDVAVVAGETPGGRIPAGTRVRTAGGLTWVTMQTLEVPEGTPTSPVVGPFVVKVRPALDDGTAVGTAASTVNVVVDQPGFVQLAVINPNALTAALTEPQIDARYSQAWDRTVALDNVVREVNFSICARRSQATQVQGLTNAVDASAQGLFGRKFTARAPLGFSRAQAIADVANYRSDRVNYTYPGWRCLIPEIAELGTAGGLGFTADGVITVGGDNPLSTINCRLNPEENPGQATGLIDVFFATEEIYENGQRVILSQADYIAFKRAGICAPRRDRTAGSIYQSGVTTSLVEGLKTQARRKMADYIQDSLANRLVPFSKKLATLARRDAIRVVIDQFLAGLQSINNPETQRISGYLVDEVSGQTPQLTALGIFFYIIKVRTLSSLDAIVLQTEIGEGVVTVTEEAVPAAA